MTYIETIIDVQTGDETTREMTKDEIAVLKDLENKAALESAAQKSEADAKAALLTKLGITAEEAALLLS